ERVESDMRDLRRQVRAAWRQQQPAERALVNEAQLRPTIGEGEPHPQMRARRSRTVDHQHLPGHAEMAEDGVAGVQREPEVLPAPPHRGDGAAGERGGEVGPACGVAPYGAGVQHVDRLDLSPDHPLGKAQDRKSTRLHSSHVKNSYAVFCLKKKKFDRNCTSHSCTWYTLA